MYISCNIIMILGRTLVLYSSKMLVLLQYDKKKNRSAPGHENNYCHRNDSIVIVRCGYYTNNNDGG